MNDLIRAILNEDFVSANRHFESVMSDIREAKLFEVKRSLGEAEGKGAFKGQFYNDKEDWAAERKKSPALGFYDTPKGRVRPTRKLHKDWDALADTRYGFSQKKKIGVKAHDFEKGMNFIKAVTQHFKDEKEKAEVKDLAAEKLARRAASAKKRAKQQMSEGNKNDKPLGLTGSNKQHYSDAIKRARAAKAARTQSMVGSLQQTLNKANSDLEQAKSASSEYKSQHMGDIMGNSSPKSSSVSTDRVSAGMSQKNNTDSNYMVSRMAKAGNDAQMAKAKTQKRATTSPELKSRSDSYRALKKSSIYKSLVHNVYKPAARALGSVSAAIRGANGTTSPSDVTHKTARAVGKGLGVTARGVAGAARGFNNYMAGTVSENIGFARPTKIIARRKRPLNKRKNKYSIQSKSSLTDRV